MNENKEVTLPVPIALQKLILANNTLLKNYQNKLLAEIQEANAEIMAILQIHETEGWALDMNRMAYVRVNLSEQQTTSDASFTE